MGRPSRDLVRVSLWADTELDTAIRAEAERRGITVAEMYRRVISEGWTAYLWGGP